MSATIWERLGALESYAPGSLATVKRRHHQLVVIRTATGDIFALDNRCPHEGYPLAQGDLKDCSLTCAWHNWKFDVRDGSCVLGGEDVRQYPVRIRDGEVEADLTDPPAASTWLSTSASLERALHVGDTGRALRDAARLLHAGYDARGLLTDVARYDALHGEFGSTHVLALAADCARLLRQQTGAAALATIAPVLDLCVDTNARLPLRPAPAPRTGATREGFRAAVEAEDKESAEAFLRGAFEAGMPRREIEDWLYSVVADHFLDFGHALIYLVKASALLDGRGNDEVSRDILTGLAYGIVLGTREDRLPYLRGYFARVQPYSGDFGRIDTRPPTGDWNGSVLRDAVLDGSAAEAIDAVWAALTDGAGAEAAAGELVAAAAHRLLRFDARWESDPEVAENWLWATHRLTFASAVRHAVRRMHDASRLQFLFQAAAFIHSGRPMDAPAASTSSTSATPAAVSIPLLMESIEARRSEDAVAIARALLADEASWVPLQRQLEALALSDRFVLPIVVTHAIKTTLAAIDERDALRDHPDRDVPLLGAIRFLASPVRERDLQMQVQRSLQWVVDGKVPRKLTQ